MKGGRFVYALHGPPACFSSFLQRTSFELRFILFHSARFGDPPHRQVFRCYLPLFACLLVDKPALPTSNTPTHNVHVSLVSPSYVHALCMSGAL